MVNVGNKVRLKSPNKDYGVGVVQKMEPTSGSDMVCQVLWHQGFRTNPLMSELELVEQRIMKLSRLRQIIREELQNVKSLQEAGGGMNNSMLNQKSNPFGLYDDHPKFAEATEALKKAILVAAKAIKKDDGSAGTVLRVADDVWKVARKYRATGADDTDSLEQIGGVLEKVAGLKRDSIGRIDAPDM